MGRTAAGQFAVCFLLTTLSGCLSYQGRNSIRRAWVDFNTLGQPAIVLEQTDHLPYHAERVGHFLWMYGSTPGHQNVYKDRRYRKDLLTSEVATSGEMATEENTSDRYPAGIAAGTVELPHPKPPTPPVDLPASPVKSFSGRPSPPTTETPSLPPAPEASILRQILPERRPPVPSPPQPAELSPAKRQRQGPSARKSAPSGWTAYRGKR